MSQTDHHLESNHAEDHLLTDEDSDNDVNENSSWTFLQDQEILDAKEETQEMVNTDSVSVGSQSGSSAGHTHQGLNARNGGNSVRWAEDEQGLGQQVVAYLQAVSQSELLRGWKDFQNQTLVPLLLLLCMPHFVMVIWFTVAHCSGSYSEMLSILTSWPPPSGLVHIWSHVNSPSLPVLLTLLLYVLYALVMMKLLLGATVQGPVTPKGNIPVYKDNGFKYFVLTISLFWLFVLFGKSPTFIYDRFDEVLLTLNIFSLVFCALLTLKGRYFPSSTDSGSSGNIIFDYYWGTELYPRIWGFDVKVFTNCRFGMMVWALLVCVNAVKSYELHGFVDSMFVSASLQVIYLAKFFWWEAGYLRTIDIMLDRAGFYICWGCLVYVPSLYTSVSFYLVTHPVHLGPILTFLFLTMGVASIYINFQADHQKQEVRQTDGDCFIWGRKPIIIRAKYQLDNGEVKNSILLASGWWGMARHFHYLPELSLAFLWSVPALAQHLLPYSYVVFLSILLVHRSFRDDEKCELKYGKYWLEYRRRVPYRIVPFLF